MGERGIDNAVIRNPKHQFVHADPGQEFVLGEQAVVGGIVQIEDIGEVAVVVRDAAEHAAIGFAVFRGDQPMRVVAANKRCPGQPCHMPPRPASRSRRTVCIAGTPPFIM